MIRAWTPDGDQQRLLATLFAPDSGVEAAWMAWRAQTALDSLDMCSQRLIPLLHERLSAVNCRHEQEARYRGVHRYWGLRNCRQRVRLVGVITLLQQAGLKDFVVAGGMALIGDIYASPAARPVNEPDLLIRPQDAARVVSALRSAGFQPASGSAAAIQAPWLDSLARRQAGIRLRHHDGDELSLSWTLYGADTALEPLFQRSVEGAVAGALVRTLCPTDALIHACVEGVRRGDVRPLWWIPDALLLLTTHIIDWPLLLGSAARNGLGPPLSAALGYLETAFDAAVPAEVLEGLSGIPAHKNDLRTRGAGQAGRPEQAWRRALRVLRRYQLHREMSSQGSLLGFLEMTLQRPRQTGGQMKARILAARALRPVRLAAWRWSARVRQGQARRQFSRAARPPMSETDLRIVADLTEHGFHVTSLEQLGLPGTEPLIGQATACMALLAAAAPETADQSEGGFAVLADAQELLANWPALPAWGRHDRLRNIFDAYLGQPSRCLGVFARRDLADGTSRGTRRWHIDINDIRYPKIIIYLNAVDDEGGPFQYLNEAASRQLQSAGGPKSVDQAQVDRLRDPRQTSCEGPAGTVIFVDTARLYHRGKPPVRERFTVFYSYVSLHPARPDLCAGVQRRSGLAL